MEILEFSIRRMYRVMAGRTGKKMDSLQERLVKQNGLKL